MDAFIGEIRIFGGDFAIKDWAFCQGQELTVSGAPGLYAVIRNTYGGTPDRTFKLPDLRNLIPVGADANNPKYNIATKGGAISYTLDYGTLPAHSHVLYATDQDPATTDPTAAYNAGHPEKGTGTIHKYVPGNSATTGALDPISLYMTGADNPAAVPNAQPYICMNFIICVYGNMPF